MSRATELAAFETYQAWLAKQSHFARFDRESDNDPETDRRAWLVVPHNYCPNVASILDESNWATLQSILAEADPTHETYELQSFGSWATPHERFVVKPDTPAHHEAAEFCNALESYPVASDDDYSERLEQEKIRQVNDLLRPLTITNQDGQPVDTDTLTDQVLQHFEATQTGRLDCVDAPGGGGPRDEDIAEALEALGYDFDEDEDTWAKSDCEPTTDE